MIYTYIKIALRNLLKKRMFVSVNITALMLGFVGFIIVSLFILYEFSWDKSHDNYDRIYRVQRQMLNMSNADKGVDISPHTHAITSSLLQQYPEFEKLTTIRENGGNFLGASLEKQMHDEHGIFADHNFFDVFTLPLTEGLQENALNEPFSVVLSESLAKSLFGTTNGLLDKTVYFEKKFNLKVTGIFKDLPKNSTVRPSYILSFSTLKRTDNIDPKTSWEGNFMTYALLHTSTDIEAVQKTIASTYQPFEGHEDEQLQLCPLSKVYLSFNGRNDYYIILLFFGLVGLFILIMAAFNYINFTIANSSTRGKEIAVKKLLGANNYSLITQFQVETLLISITATFLALLVVKLLLPLYNSFTNTTISLSIRENGWGILFLLGISIAIGFLSGLYPSWVLASKRIVNLFKEGVFSAVGRRIDEKRILIVLQFSISIFLVCLSLMFMTQVKYITNKDLGFKKTNVLYSQMNVTLDNGNFEAFRQRLMQHPEIVNVAKSRTLPFVNMWGGEINWDGSQPDENILYRPNWVSYDYIETMQYELLAGRGFSKEFTADIDQSCVINETALEYFGWKNPIGKRINNNTWTIIGVVKDFHHMDVHNAIDPGVLLLADEELSGNWIFSVRYREGMKAEALALLGNEFTAKFPNDPFQFELLDNAFLNENAYKIYQTINKSIIFFTVFIILLAVIALLGMVTYITSRRSKEIGIRKINGSTLLNLFLLLNRDFFMLFGISIIIAWPLAYMAYDALPGSHKIDMPYWMFIASGLIIAAIILITTSLQILKAARRNPIEALRYE